MGYFLLSLVITNWVQVTHGFDLNGTAIGRGITYIGVPVAAWLAMSRRFRPATGVSEAEAPTSDLYSVG